MAGFWTKLGCVQLQDMVSMWLAMREATGLILTFAAGKADLETFISSIGVTDLPMRSQRITMLSSPVGVPLDGWPAGGSTE